MLKGELTKKVHVLEEIDQMLHSLNTIDRQIQAEVGTQISEEEDQRMNHIKKLENDLIFLQKTYYNQEPGKSGQTEKEHPYHLTLSY